MNSNLFAIVLTAILCGANLAAYSWSSHAPMSLGVGIFCGVASLLVMGLEILNTLNKIEIEIACNRNKTKEKT